MHRLSFWYRLAFIANCCWLATWVIKYYAFLPAGEIQSTIVVTGLITAYIVNIVVNIFTVILLFRGKLSGIAVPRWLLLANGLFLLAQLYLFFK
jgi:hypothetical protein